MSDTLIDLIPRSSGGKAARVRRVDIGARTRPASNNLQFIKFSNNKTLADESCPLTRRWPIGHLAAERRHHYSDIPYQYRGAGSGVSCNKMVRRMASVTRCTSVSRPRLRSQNHEGLNDVAREQERDKCLAPAEINSSASSLRYKRILACRRVPILFILICLLIVANTKCDHVGSPNVGAETSPSIENSNNDNNKDYQQQQQQDQQQQREPMKPRVKQVDPLSMLREIYLDHDSKIITMLSPPTDTVQKFHPNGRYGRRSMDNFAEPHAELGHLVYDDQLDRTRSLAGDEFGVRSGDSTSTLRRILHNMNRDETMDTESSEGGHQSGRMELAPVVRLQANKLYSTRRPASMASAPLSRAASEHQNRGPNLDSVFASNGAQVANLKLEMTKLLKCNYSGVSGLYWCDPSSPEATSQASVVG